MSAALDPDAVEGSFAPPVSPRVAYVVLAATILVMAAGIGAVWTAVSPHPVATIGALPQPTPTLDDLASSMARAMAEGNPEVLRHQAYTYERQTGCRVRWVDASVDRWDGTAVTEEAAARESIIARLAGSPGIDGVSHGRADSDTSPGHVVHLIVAQSCRS